jgi:NAD(P)H-dependent flavin oxidoreductase YrpB (nitropropane dioxygenase family)
METSPVASLVASIPIARLEAAVRLCSMSSAAAASLLSRMRLPVIGAPLFIISNPKLVTAQCVSGIVGSFPALNARPKEALDDWLSEIKDRLAEHDATNEQKAAPFAVNQIVHRSNDRLMHDMDIIVKHKVPLVITSLGAREDINAAVHSYGGIVLHDVSAAEARSLDLASVVACVNDLCDLLNDLCDLCEHR